MNFEYEEPSMEIIEFEDDSWVMVTSTNGYNDTKVQTYSVADDSDSVYR